MAGQEFRGLVVTTQPATERPHAPPPATLRLDRPRRYPVPGVAPGDRRRPGPVELRVGPGPRLWAHGGRRPRGPAAGAVGEHHPATAPRVLPPGRPQARGAPDPGRP